jgi:hypothetical protein
VQFDFAYTLGKGRDNAPITGVLSVQAENGRSDPENLDLDYGPNVLEQRHTFTGSVVAMPRIEGANAALRGLVNGTVVGVAMQFASGIPINIRTTADINADGIAADRPVGVSRNSLTLPARYNVDLRLSRQIGLGGSMKAEVLAELKNVFNRVQWSSVSGTQFAVNAVGEPTTALPTSGDQLRPSGGYEQRQFQLGFRFIF